MACTPACREHPQQHDDAGGTQGARARAADAPSTKCAPGRAKGSTGAGAASGSLAGSGSAAGPHAPRACARTRAGAGERKSEREGGSTRRRCARQPARRRGSGRSAERAGADRVEVERHALGATTFPPIHARMRAPPAPAHVPAATVTATSVSRKPPPPPRLLPLTGMPSAGTASATGAPRTVAPWVAGSANGPRKGTPCAIMATAAAAGAPEAAPVAPAHPTRSPPSWHRRFSARRRRASRRQRASTPRARARGTPQRGTTACCGARGGRRTSGSTRASHMSLHLGVDIFINQSDPKCQTRSTRVPD